MNKDINNKYRVLLTEVLPYELPILLNNEAFYENMQNENYLELFKKILRFDEKKKWRIPMDYNVRRMGGERSRKLSLMHPVTQLEFVDFYSEHDESMINLCNRSPFSIRHITKKARCIFSPDESNEASNSDDVSERTVEIDENSIDKKYRSYFKYEKYDLIYKFFESGDNLRLEQKYPHMLMLDISGCFYHIYTHSLAWAVKSKDFAKMNTGGKTFENKFDKLMQYSNYNETNGIIVGPEISRIFAEIILQSVDLAIMHQLKDQYGYRLGRDYEVRRYVDDSYVYATKIEILDRVKDAYQEQLAFYKMELNKSKIEYCKRPFTTSVSDAKRELNKVIDEFSERYLKTKNDKNDYERNCDNEMTVFTSFVKQFRSIAHQFQQPYGALNKYMLTLVLKQIRKEIERKRIPSQGLLIAYLEISFFIFSLDMHTSASYRLCSILDCLARWATHNTDRMVFEELKNRMRREAKRVLDIYQSDNSEANTNMEALNLLITLNRIIGYKLTLKQIESLFCITVSKEKREGFDKLNYFQICTLLYVIENDPLYEGIKSFLEQEIISRIKSYNDLIKAENAYLFFDIMTCPYIDKEVGMKIMCNVMGCSENKAKEERDKVAKPKRWFFDWDKKRELIDFLSKKEYHSPYE